MHTNMITVEQRMKSRLMFQNVLNFFFFFFFFLGGGVFTSDIVYQSFIIVYALETN